MLVRIVTALTGILLAVAAPPALAASPDVVISQVYGGGGTVAGPYKSDFVELHNTSGSAVDLAGWSIQYASAAGTTWNAGGLGGTIQPGGYYLIEMATGMSGAALPLPDATIGSISMSAAAGKLALVTTAAALSACDPNCRLQPGVRDFVGWQTGATVPSEFEGSGAVVFSGTSGTQSAVRQGCGDTDDNAVDFLVTTSIAPRNSATPAVPCVPDVAPAVTATVPANGATGVALAANLSVTFSESVTGQDSFALTCAGVAQTIAVTPAAPATTYAIDPAVDLPGGAGCTLASHAAQVVDQDGSPDHPAADLVVSFGTAAAPVAGTPPAGGGTPPGGGETAHLTLKAATVSGRWSVSRFKGSLTVTGTAPAAGAARVQLFRAGGSKALFAVTRSVPAGAFKLVLPAPAGLLPGNQRVVVTLGADRLEATAKLAAPREGVVDRIVIAARQGGPAVLALNAPRTIAWVRFHFAALPRAGSVTTAWIAPGGKTTLGPPKPRTALVDTFASDPRGLAKGTWTCVLRAGGKVVAKAAVRIR